MRRALATIAITLLSVQPVAVFAIENDTDGDGIADTVEDANRNGIVDGDETDPLNADTDGGGEADGSEILNKRSPLDGTDDYTFDRDGDGLTNGREAQIGTDPDRPDSDGDGTNDKEDVFPLDPDFAHDADHDDIADEWEARHRLSTTSDDALGDNDNDGLSNLDEFIQNTNPADPDTDRDGIEDGKEVTEGSNPEESACLSYANTGITPLPDIIGHWAQRRIEILQNTRVIPGDRAIVDGYPQQDGTRLFLPERPITRFELLKLALLSNCIRMLGDAEKPPVTFTDIPFHKRPYESEDRQLRRQVVYTAAIHGIVQGYDDGTFRPDEPITRAEALKIILKASRLPELFGVGEVAYDNTFVDVPADTWFTSFVAEGIALSLIDGYEDQTFRPGNNITRAEAAKLIHAAMIGNPGVNSQIIPAD